MDNNMNNNSGNGGNNTPRKQNILVLVVAALITMLCMTYFMRVMTSSDNEPVEYSEFITMLENGEIESVVIEKEQIIFEKVDSEEEEQPVSLFAMAQGKPKYVTGKAEDDTTLTARLLEKGVSVKSEIPDSSGAIMSFIMYYVVPILLMWLILSYVFRKMSKGGGPLSIGKNNAKVYMQRETGVTFKDVAGEDEAKESLVEVVDFLHNPGRYVKIGAKLPKGALLVGPPGTGKTLLAKAVAGEAHVPFYSLAGSDFIELYVGVGASRVRELFAEASKNAPCIIFIDEIDAIGRSRDSKYGGGNEEREQTLNQLLSEMDGFDSSKGVLVLGATNRPEILDKALLRPGRFDRRIIVDKPDLKGREEILKVHSKDVKMDETVDLKGVALATSGAVGSDLANMINEAAINAVKAHREYVCQQDLMEAVEQVLVGKEKKDRILSKEERKIVSYHEVGHALISAVQKNTEPVQKITIVPRTMGALGYVMQVPEDEKYLMTKDELLDDIIVSLGGRAAEEVIFNTVTTGAENDIEKATSMARAMVTMYGMSEKFGLMQLESVQNKYLDGNRVLNCSQQTEYLVDEEVKALLASCYEKAKQIIRDHLTSMDKIAQFLIEKETITGKEFMKIYREVENIPEPTEEEAEAAKHGRIYATRPESAAVGENIPTKEERAKAEQAEAPATPSFEAVITGLNGEDVISTSTNNADNETPKETESPKEQPTSGYGISWGSETVEAPSYAPAKESAPEEDQPISGGKFSHVPDDFDK